MMQRSAAPSPSRIAAVAAKPSMRGIWQSIRIRSYRVCDIASSAALPSAATSTSKPRLSSNKVATIWLTSLSSANRTLPEKRGEDKVRELSGNAPVVPFEVVSNGATNAGCKRTVNQKFEPRPSSLVTPISPPIMLTSWCEIVSPSPLPP